MSEHVSSLFRRFYGLAVEPGIKDQSRIVDEPGQEPERPRR